MRFSNSACYAWVVCAAVVMLAGCNKNSSPLAPPSGSSNAAPGVAALAANYAESPHSPLRGLSLSTQAIALTGSVQRPPTDNVSAVIRGRSSLPTMTNIVLTTIPNAPSSGLPELAMQFRVDDLPIPSSGTVPQYQWGMYFGYLGGLGGQDVLAANATTPISSGPQLEVVVLGNAAQPVKGTCTRNPTWGSQPLLWCYLSYPWTVGHVFEFATIFVGSDPKTEYWLAQMTDKTNNTTQEIAEWKVPVAYGLLNSYPNGSVDYYGPLPNCDAEPYAKSSLSAIEGQTQRKEYDGSITSSAQNECKRDNRIGINPSGTGAVIWSGLSNKPPN